MKVFNFFCAILLFMKFTLSSEAAFYTSNSETDSHESTSDTSQITTSESENDEVFSFSTTDDVKLLSTDDFEYVKTDNALKNKNLETMNTFISHNEKVISNCKSNIVDSLLSTSDSENLEVSTTSKSEQDDKIDKKCYLEEFRRDMIKMFLLIQKNRDFSTTKANLNSLKDIENDLNNERKNDNESNLNCLKNYSDLIHVFLIFFDDEENDNSPEFLQKRISKVLEKLENIDEVTTMVNELYNEEGLDPLDLIKFKEEITRLKELLEEETKHYLNYIDFRRENYQNNSSLIKEKLLKFQENLKIKTNEMFFMIPDEFKNMEPLFDDDFVEEINEFLRGLYYIIDDYSPFLMNYQDALNDIWIFNKQL